jgi:hypothetical protein
VKPTPEQQQAKVDAARQELFESAGQSIFKSLEAHKKAHGSNGLEQAAIGAALVAFANLLGRNGRFVAGRDTQGLIRFGIEVIAGAAADAKRRCEEKRIVTL